MLTYSHDIVLLMEVAMRWGMSALQNQLETVDYIEAMITKLGELDEVRHIAMDYLHVQMNRVVRAYNKRVRETFFYTNDLV